MTRIAGHDFEHGSCVRLGVNGMPCRRRWADIRNTPRSDVGQPDIAHFGALAPDEWEQIDGHAREEDARFERATMQCAGIAAQPPEQEADPGQEMVSFPVFYSGGIPGSFTLPTRTNDPDVEWIKIWT